MFKTFLVDSTECLRQNSTNKKEIVVNGEEQLLPRVHIYANDLGSVAILIFDLKDFVGTPYPYIIEGHVVFHVAVDEVSFGRSVFRSFGRVISNRFDFANLTTS